MVRIQLLLRSLSPVAFSARRSTSNFIDTLDYVPGSALRGATAARYLREIGEAPDSRFQAVFVQGEASFGNLYPVRYSRHSFVIPATARSCKAFEGFRSNASPDTHGVFDTLMLAASAQASQDFSQLESIANCRLCGGDQPTHRFCGFYEEPLVPAEKGNRIHSKTYARVDLNKRHLTHVGINRQSQSAEPGFLYAQQVISEAWPDAVKNGDHTDKVLTKFKPQDFSGDLLVSDTQADYVLNTLLETGATLRLGESRSRGLGKMKVESIARLESDTEATIRERILEFNRHLTIKSDHRSQVEYIALTLQSDAILTDPFLRNSAAVKGEDISRAFGAGTRSVLINSGDLTLVYANAERRLAQSWNVASGYPKSDAIAIAMGAVFLFEVPGRSVEDLLKSLVELQESGIGERRSEGFGRVSVCDPFHWEVQEHGNSPS